jgi:O-antigen/teichoic acid export membrane protein
LLEKVTNFLIVFIFAVLAETVGLWFLNVYMSIPTSRLAAANWVYQFSVLSFIIVIIAAPYMSIVLAREKMATFALISFTELSLKLFIAYMLIFSADDKLRLYAVLLFITTAVCNAVYIVYSMRNFPECEFSRFWCWIRAKEIIQYSGWNAIGSIAILLRTQGTNILLNVFFGPILSAAQAVSTQIQGAMASLLASTYTATRPRIIKYYAAGNSSDMWRLVFDSTRLSYYLIFLVAAPFFFEGDYILSLWLNEVPSYASGIVKLMLIVILLEATSNQLVAVLQAANKIKRFQICSVGLLYWHSQPQAIF